MTLRSTEAPHLPVHGAARFVLVSARMWIVLGNKMKAQKVAGGRALTCPCGACGQATLHVEHDVRDKVSAFFVTLFAATQRRMICVASGEDLDPEDAHARARRR